MSDSAAIPQVRTTPPEGQRAPGEALVCAFNEVRTELVSTLYYYLGNYEDAEDAVQEAFYKCWRGLDGMAAVVNLKAWIFRVGMNAAKDLQRNAYRRRARPLSRLPVEESKARSPVEAAQEHEDDRRLRDALLDLRPEEKEVFLLRQNGGLTYDEIAEIRRAPVGTVKTQMRAAIAKLRDVLQEK